MSDDVATCRVCGCTDEAACPGGCAWVSTVPCIVRHYDDDQAVLPRGR